MMRPGLGAGWTRSFVCLVIVSPIQFISRAAYTCAFACVCSFVGVVHTPIAVCDGFGREKIWPYKPMYDIVFAHINRVLTWQIARTQYAFVVWVNVSFCCPLLLCVAFKRCPHTSHLADGVYAINAIHSEQGLSFEVLQIPGRDKINRKTPFIWHNSLGVGGLTDQPHRCVVSGRKCTLLSMR